MSVTYVRVDGKVRRLVVAPPEEIRSGQPVYDHDQHRAVMVADLGYAALIRREDNSHHWRARALITPASQD